MKTVSDTLSLPQRFLSKIFSYRGYLVDYTPKADYTTGMGFIKGARESHILTKEQVERAFSKNY